MLQHHLNFPSWKPKRGQFFLQSKTVPKQPSVISWRKYLWGAARRALGFLMGSLSSLPWFPALLEARGFQGRAALHEQPGWERGRAESPGGEWLVGPGLVGLVFVGGAVPGHLWGVWSRGSAAVAHQSCFPDLLSSECKKKKTTLSVSGTTGLIAVLWYHLWLGVSSTIRLEIEPALLIITAFK